MEMVLNNGFCEMSQEEMKLVDGGGVGAALFAFFGGVCIAGSVVADVAMGPAVGVAVFGLGCGLLDVACDHPDW